MMRGSRNRMRKPSLDGYDSNSNLLPLRLRRRFNYHKDRTLEVLCAFLILKMTLLFGIIGSLLALAALNGSTLLAHDNIHSHNRLSLASHFGNNTSGKRVLNMAHEKPDQAKMHPEIDFDTFTEENPGAFLYAKLLRNHSPFALPVNRSKDAVAIRLLVKLAQIVDVDEKSQIMTTNVWLRHEWYDSKLMWNPDDYGGIQSLYIPADEIWLPDTVLYNNADGDYQITIHTKAEVRFDGMVIWEPPAMYKSFCAIDVEFFPYDSQLCEMKVLGPWTHDVSKVNYFLIGPHGHEGDVQDVAVDLSGFIESVEWDVIGVQGIRQVFQYPCCQEHYVDLTYLFNIRRKTLFYTINLIAPCVLIALATVLVFYLPCQSGEKVAFSTSTLLALTWFILLLSEIIPPTSLALPLMGKYLLFTMILVTLSIAVTVMVLYNHFRHPHAYTMPYWVRYIFLDLLPLLLCFKANSIEKNYNNNNNSDSSLNNDRDSNNSDSSFRDEIEIDLLYENILSSRRFMKRQERQKEKQQSSSRSPLRTPPKCNRRHHHSRTSSWTPHSMLSLQPSSVIGSLSCGPSPCFVARHSPQTPHRPTRMSDELARKLLLAPRSEKLKADLWQQTLGTISQYMMLPEVQEAIRCIHFISKRYQTQGKEMKVKSDWEAVSRVIDRLFLIIFSSASFLGTISILLRAESLFDPTPSLVATKDDELIVEHD